MKAVDLADNNKPVVMKIMRALSKGVIKKMPSAATRGCQSYNDILNELVVTQALSQLHDGVILNGKSNALYKTHFFCLIHEIKVVSGNMERALIKSQTTPTLIGGPTAISSSNGVAAQATNGATNTTTTTTTNNNHNLAGLSDDEIKLKLAAAAAAAAAAASGTKGQQVADDKDQIEIKDEDLKNLSEDDRMLMEALPYEYVVSVMRHDGQPLWWMMRHKKLSAEQLTSVLVQVIVGIAIAEKVYLYEHRDLHVSNILIKKTSKSMIPFILDGNKFNIISHNIKATIIDATFSRLTHNSKIYYRDLTSTLRAYGSKKTPTKMSLQNRSYRQMVHITKNNWEDFTPKTNLIWLTYLCETLMKNDIMKANVKLLNEIKKIRDYTLKVNTTFDLLGHFPFDKDRTQKTTKAPTSTVTTATTKSTNTTLSHLPSRAETEVQRAKDGGRKLAPYK